VVFCFDASRVTRVAESSSGRFVPQLKKFRRPEKIASITSPPVFGRALYELLGQAKIVVKGAIDMAGNNRGNMRCFEPRTAASRLTASKTWDWEPVGRILAVSEHEMDAGKVIT
jgi:hypothetical protein